MASEIRVNKLNSQTGVGTITLSPTGVDISGITTAETLKATTGIVTTLTVTTGIVTSLSANEFGIGTDNPNTELEIQAATDPKIRLQSQESGNKRLELYVDGGEAVGTIAADQSSSQLAFRTSGAERLRIEAAGNLKSNHNLSVTGIATVGSAVTISESGIEASGIGITVANINGGQIGGRRNIIINGAMNIAQRNTTSTSEGYTCDRFNILRAGVDESPTHAQVDVASGTTPYTNGFRKALKITNGNQTGGAGAGDYILTRYKVEAQDMAKSGWNYVSSSSYVTLSFWIKSSVAQNFYFNMISSDGTPQNYAYETGSLSADTWTKVIKKIPGASNVQFNSDNGVGLQLDFWAFAGTNYTDGGVTLNQWAAYSSGGRMPDHTSTWYTTNDATLEITGVQLEVGSQATPFEHRGFSEELLLCQRYYYKSTEYDYPVQNPIATSKTTDVHGYLGWVFYNTTSCRSFNYENPVEMRASPTVNFYSSGQVSSPADGKMAVYDGSAWQNLTSNTSTSNTRRIGIKGTYTPGLAQFHTYLIGGAFDCGAEL